MKSFNKVAPGLFLILTIIFAGALSLTLLCGRYFVPVSSQLFCAIIAVISLIFVYMSSEGADEKFPGKNFLCAVLPFATMLFTVFYTYNAKTDVIYAIVSAITYFAASLFIFYRCCDSKKMKLILSVVYFVVLVLPFAFSMLLFNALAKNKAANISTTVTSPSGNYTAVAENYRVEIVPESKKVNIFIGYLVPFSHTIFESKIDDIFAEQKPLTVNWIDNTTLKVNDMVFDMKYVADANLFYNFSENAEKLSAYVPQRYANTIDVDVFSTSHYGYNLTNEEIALIDNDIANNSKWQKVDETEISNRFDISETSINLSDYDYYCITPEEFNKYVIVALYSKENGKLDVIRKDFNSTNQ